jgi:hypothetical protein
MKRIPLTRGMFALVDDEDFEWLSIYRWNAHAVAGFFYATASRYRGQVKTQPYMHRLIMRPTPGKRVDHINHDTLDNRKSNLRICSPSQNLWNSKIPLSNKSGYKGVSKCSATGRWRVDIRKSGKGINIGRFVDIRKAAMAYDREATRMFGEFALTNRKLGLL